MDSKAAWFRSATFRTQGAHPGIDIGAEDGRNIATVHFDVLTETKEEVIARADLIVAAKDMYKALSRAALMLEDIASQTPENAADWVRQAHRGHCLWRDHIDEARAAIAKAQGAA